MRYEPSNDADVPADEIVAAVCAHSDADHASHEACGDDWYEWDISRPLAHQWPWSGGPSTRAIEFIAELRAHLAAESHLELTGPTDQGQPVSPNAFLPEDSATAEPWADPGASTRMTDAELIETVAYAPPGSVRE